MHSTRPPILVLQVDVVGRDTETGLRNHGNRVPMPRNEDSRHARQTNPARISRKVGNRHAQRRPKVNLVHQKARPRHLLVPGLDILKGQPRAFTDLIKNVADEANRPILVLIPPLERHLAGCQVHDDWLSGHTVLLQPDALLVRQIHFNARRHREMPRLDARIQVGQFAL